MKYTTLRTTAARLALISILGLACLASCSRFGAKLRKGNDYNYLIGRGMADITGPAVGIPMFGFVRADQISEGIHFRLRSRAFVIAEPGKEGKRVAFVSADLGSITHEMTREILEKLHKQFGDLYTLQNVVICATHTHCGPGGYWHYGSNTPVGGFFYQQHFDAICDGIAQSIAAAHKDLQPGKILINRGRVEGAGANRSAVAYDLNPAEERARYDGNTDKEMTLLKFTRAGGDIGMINWFAVHPTSMTFYNKPITGDHKGYASLDSEKKRGDRYESPNDFVAAFANTNCGDVTPNLNLNNTGPGKDQFETCKIIGDRQLAEAERLFSAAAEQISGPLDFRQSYVDFSGVMVGDEYTRHGPQSTCPSALGYSFGAGSTEDGGGHPLLHEGMTKRDGMVDSIIKQFGNIPEPSAGLRACQAPKPILFATGEMNPPAQAQVIPLSVVRIGQLALVCGPGEFTTMTGRRIREAVAKQLGDTAKYVVMACYANGYQGYVTTYEEYQSQQYEGGHTLYGPWTQAAYAQEFSRLARDLKEGKPSATAPTPYDPRGKIKSEPLGTPFDATPPGINFGDAFKKPNPSYKRGETAEAAFWTGHPQNDYHTGGTFLEVQREEGGKWVTIATDADWETKCRWTMPNGPPPPNPYGMTAPSVRAGKVTSPEIYVTISWDIPADAKPGNYRIVHHGAFKKQDGAVQKLDAVSEKFTLE
ncbi:neutral/alkaline ceramidase [Candidatus Sumerlaeota bacterium]|nr:neutral/alkaline ceramidase [Candidatus Sumerlaeota bacterium]